jgi:hypothetical protein
VFFFLLGALEKESYVLSALLQVNFADTDPVLFLVDLYPRTP